MLTREFINSFYDKLPAYGVDSRLVKIEESNITLLQEKTFDVKDSKGGIHWFYYDGLIQKYSEAVKIYKKKHKKKILKDIKDCKYEIKYQTKELERLQKELLK